MNGLTSSAIPPETIQKANSQLDSFFLSNGTQENRIVYHSDGTTSFIPKSPAYIVGEQILRPCIDNMIYYSSGLIRIISNSLSFLDTRLSSLFKIFPVSAAQSDSLNEVDSFESPVVPWNPKNPESDFEEYVRDLSLAQRNTLYQNPFFRDNFKIASTIKRNTIEFIDKIAQAYQIHEEALYKYCESYQNIYHKMDEIVRDLEFHNIYSDYSPFEHNDRTLILEFPEFVVNPAPSGHLPSIVITEGTLSFNKQSLLPPTLNPSKESGVTEIKNRIKKKFLEGAAFDLAIFTVRKDIPLKDFGNLFEHQRIKFLTEHVNKKKKEIEQWVKNEGNFLKNILDEKNLEMRKYIQHRIDTLFELQKDMIEDLKKKGTWYKIDKLSGQKTSISEWKVKEGSVFGDLIKFHFYVTNPLMDPLDHEDL